MLVVDATCLYELVADNPAAVPIGHRLQQDDDHAAPHVIDVEVLAVIRRHAMLGILDTAHAAGAVAQLRDWPGERWGHQHLLARAWELRDNVRGWDATYVALAESLDATLLTLDRRLSRCEGPRCAIEVIE